MQDEDEPGIANVMVRLLDGVGNALAPPRIDITDANGIYTFTGVCSGEYQVQFERPPGLLVHDL